ncbi:MULTISPECIES: cytochrome b [unclassified Xanthobacter]|uniref:cytochrome b n=1 Tax=unclassified Xanthobacter TaxID=2623496 RepID=UPI001EDEB451|nr:MULTISPECIES: cytochrome b/b6 domain-containing protein [unclassified Xanthobacter]
MSVDPTLTRYPPTLRALHWLTVLAVVVVYGVTYLEGFFARGTPERAWIWWTHISVGLLLIAFLAVRIPVRVLGRVPGPSHQISRPVAIASASAHGLLYLLLIATPLVGIYLTFLRGGTVSFFSLFTIPSPIAVNRDLAGTVKEVHETLANALVLLALLHAAAAVVHHVVFKDDVLKRMLPERCG